MRQPFETILKSLEPSMEDANVVMCILSNYTPQCVVECTVSCDIQELAELSGIYSPKAFASRFEQAVYIATHDPYRAATHNKGIFNGIDAVVLATGNDFRAIEANGHAFAAKDGKYRSLTSIKLTDNTFTYTLTVPLTIGTVGGLTTLHPIAKTSLELLGHPSATQLMKIVAAAGLANNFMAVTSLITHGIQKGHMKLHLNNILRTLEASEYQIDEAQQYFSDKTVSYSAVKLFLAQTTR
jgi:hydroxymethylglutaryl-CoA reductase